MRPTEVERLRDERTTTFASHYKARVTLELTRESVLEYNARRMGEKYLVTPHGWLNQPHVHCFHFGRNSILALSKLRKCGFMQLIIRVQLPYLVIFGLPSGVYAMPGERYAVESVLGSERFSGASRFDRIFPLPAQGSTVDPATLQSWLTSLGQALVDQPPVGTDVSTLPSGYTYLGQFIDHDLTLDPTNLPDEPIDIAALNNFRSPAFDLDSLLGFGPSVHPWLYVMRRGDPTEGQLRTAPFNPTPINMVAHDLPRLQGGTPLIGDPRNDENLAVAQLHTAFISFYNKIHNQLQAGVIPDVGPAQGSLTEKSSRILRWHYQWIVLNDYLPRVINPTILKDVISSGPKHYLPDPNSPYMPVEFAGAAFRFGHTLVRERYGVNRIFPDQGMIDLFTFSSSGGSVPVPASWALDWNRFFDIDGAGPVNLARGFDPYIAPALHDLQLPSGPSSLAVRNLLRGWTWSLPSGQAIAGALGLYALTPDQILLDAGGVRYPEADVVEPFSFHTDTPLWYYILKEAQVLEGAQCLGPVGSTIVAETIVGLLKADASSFLTLNPGWTPFLPAQTAGTFEMADLLRYLPTGAINPNG